jgi:hypothetical protein
MKHRIPPTHSFTLHQKSDTSLDGSLNYRRFFTGELVTAPRGDVMGGAERTTPIGILDGPVGVSAPLVSPGAGGGKGKSHGRGT